MPDPDRLDTIRRYFRLVDARDAALLDLFTDDVAFFFPKFGSARGKAAVAAFGERIGREVVRLAHDIDGLVFTVQGDRIAVEGREWGTTRSGRDWPDGAISEGRFCNVFEFDGPLISRVHIYVDPDYANEDHRRLAIYRCDGAVETAREVAARYLAGVERFYRDRTEAALEALVALFDDEVDWDIPGDVARVSYIGPRRGKPGVSDFFRELVSRIEPRSFDVATILGDEDTAVVVGNLASLVIGTGRMIETPFAFVITVREGKIVRYRMLEDSHAVSQAN